MKTKELTISIVLAALSCLPAQAQLGGALKKTVDAAKKVENVAEKSQESVPVSVREALRRQRQVRRNNTLRHRHDQCRGRL